MNGAPVSAQPRRPCSVAQFSNGDHNVASSIRLCESRRAGVNPVGLPTFSAHPVVSLVAQPAERPPLNREVDGANPSKAETYQAPIAQYKERRVSNAEVAGEI